MPEILKKCCLKVQQRYVMFALTFGALSVCYLDRQTYFKFMDDNVVRDRRSHADVSSVSKCPAMMSNSDNNLNNQAQFYWSNTQVKIITQCFYIGYLVVLIPSGVVTDIYGARVSMSLGVLVSSITTLVSPMLAEAFDKGPINLMLARFFQGIAQGLVLPATAVMIANWAPVTIRATATGIVNSGFLFGWGLGYWQHDLFYSYMPENPDKWKATFYVSGAIGLVWVLLWFSITGSYCSCSANPRNNRCISQAELDLLKRGLQGIDQNQIQRMNPHVPWRAIFTSPPVLSLTAIYWVSTWMHFLALQRFDDYLRNIIGMSEKLSNNTTTFAEFTIGPATIFWGFVSDWLINKNYMSRTANRKYFAFFSNILMIPCLFGILLVGCNGLAAVSLYITFSFVRSPYYSSVRANAVDLSPHHAGLLQGIFSCSAAASALFITELFNRTVGYEPSNIDNWWKLFGVSSVLLVLMTLPYLWFGSADIQPWNRYQPKPRALRNSQTSTQVPAS